MPADDFESLAARADMARLLAACFYEPGPEFAEAKLFDAMEEAATRFDPALAERAGRLGEAFGAEDLQELLVDYTRLFLGPTGALAPPYGSVWLEDRSSLLRDSTRAAVALYGEGGFEIADDFRDLPDHVAAELEFLYLLLFRRAEASRHSDTDAAGIYRQLQRRFLDEHLGRWAAPFTRAMQEGAQTGFFRELALTTRTFVDSEIVLVGNG